MNLQSKILVIDDDERLGTTIKNVLTLNGYDVCYANNGALGIQKAFEYNPDLILCDIAMRPIDGYQVYNVLKESSLIDFLPFIFITGSSGLDEIRFGMDLGADDYFVKPFENERLVNSVAKRLAKYRKLKELGKHEFMALFNLSPNGIFLFDEEVVFEMNPSLAKTVGLKIENFTTYPIDNLMDAKSFETIKDKISRCSAGLLHSFSQDIVLVAQSGKNHHVKLYVSVYEKYSGYSLMLGLVIEQNGQKIEESKHFSDVLGVLKKENIVVTDVLGDKLTEVFKTHNVRMENQKNGFFSERENQVLCLSMEGLPIKLIADKLSISDRTVEKHRAKLMEKTNLKNIIEAIIFALRNNLIKI